MGCGEEEEWVVSVAGGWVLVRWKVWSDRCCDLKAQEAKEKAHLPCPKSTYDSQVDINHRTTSKFEGIFTTISLLSKWPAIQSNGKRVCLRQLISSTLQLFDVPVTPEILAGSAQELAFVAADPHSKASR